MKVRDGGERLEVEGRVWRERERGEVKKPCQRGSEEC